MLQGRDLSGHEHDAGPVLPPGWGAGGRAGGGAWAQRAPWRGPGRGCCGSGGHRAPSWPAALPGPSSARRPRARWHRPRPTRCLAAGAAARAGGGERRARPPRLSTADSAGSFSPPSRDHGHRGTGRLWGCGRRESPAGFQGDPVGDGSGGFPGQRQRLSAPAIAPELPGHLLALSCRSVGDTAGGGSSCPQGLRAAPVFWEPAEFWLLSPCGRSPLSEGQIYLPAQPGGIQ